MKMFLRRKLVVLASVAFLMTACGGGGGGGGEATTPADAAYTGIRTQAYIDVNNAQALVLGAYGGVDYNQISPLSIASPDVTPNNPFGLTTLYKHVAALVNPEDQIKPQALLDPALECVNYPNGTLSDSLVESIDASTDTVSGSIFYSNCDTGGVILNGTVTVTASMNLATNNMTLVMTLNPLSYDYGVTIFSLTGRYSGTMSTNIAGYQVSHLNLNMTLDDLAGQTYWLNDYVIDETEESTGVRSTVSGRYFHNDYGYVDFITDPNDKIFIPYNPLEPTYDGRLDYTGSNGSTATLWLGVNLNDYCINVFNVSGNVDLGTCAQ
jgi:hypothetical protein